MHLFHKHIPTYFTIILILCWLSGCTKEALVEVFNNSDAKLEVTSKRQTITIERYSSCVLSFDEIVEGISIRSNGRTLLYTSPMLDEWKIRKWLKGNSKVNILTTQVNEDGVLYVVAPNEKLPTLQYPAQPNGFPLHPK
jgi:hypothetical protein